MAKRLLLLFLLAVIFSAGCAVREEKPLSRETGSTIEDYDRAIQLNPGDAKAHYNRGVAYNGLKQYRRAIADFHRVIELGPGDAKAHYNRGVAYNGLKQYRRAITDFDRAVELDPGDTQANYNRGPT